jgi:hypothetical protein
MLRTRLVCLIGAGLLLCGMSLPVFACEGGNPNQVTVQAPLDAVNCTATPPTISALGLTIDVSQATFGGDWWEHGGSTQTCADLTVGQTVKVKLAGDVPATPAGPLTATAIETVGGGCQGHVPDVKVSAPLQTVDPGGLSVTVLGLVVNTAQAVIVGYDRQPITLDPRMVGQFARLKLVSNQVPLAATALMAHGVKIRVMAPIDSTSCDATIPTITVLGLTIDISHASLGTPWSQFGDGHEGDGGGSYGWGDHEGDGDDDEQGEDQGEGPDDHDGDATSAPMTCADLVAGQTVLVNLADLAPAPTSTMFTADAVTVFGGGCGHRALPVALSAPLQAVDTVAPSVTALGLLIGIGQATLLDSNGQPLTASQLVAGQFADVLLVSNQAPLTASTVQVQPPVGVLTVLVVDEKGAPVNDGSVNSVRADLTIRVGKQIMRFVATSNGSFTLTGLPKGQAKIVVTRVNNGQTSVARGAVKVKAKGTQKVRVRLKPVKA